MHETVEKWRKHRRIITPAFNMRLLESFFEIFNRKNQLLIEQLKTETGTGKHFDAWKYISSTALDIICGESSVKIYCTQNKYFTFMTLTNRCKN